ncbi:uncharacterized protein K02A2.6-like [Venturia canescens]|uniref:uncharacterized protein K02A2.6-like n=1 Tax=Venturia canescens TaxID=32260 RepID=UPI001C9C8981|nr:uncharacterized protein K02A2.6-like [Venturia canescens]
MAIHNKRLSDVLCRLRDCGLTANKSKCIFGSEKIQFLGYILDGTGIHAATDKIKAIVDAPAPTNITQLRAFLGYPQMAATRVQRWAVFLSAYHFEIKHVKGIDNSRADSLSRIPLPIDESKFKENEDYTYLNYVIDEVKTLDTERVARETMQDPILKRICEFVLKGWPDKMGEEFSAFYSRKLEFTIEEGCLLWGHRVVIPPSMREELLQELHVSHMGVVKMKALARSYIWWPNIDREIENVTKSCISCLKWSDNPPSLYISSELDVNLTLAHNFFNFSKKKKMDFKSLNKVATLENLPWKKLIELEVKTDYPIHNIRSVKTKFGKRYVADIGGEFSVFLPG